MENDEKELFDQERWTRFGTWLAIQSAENNLKQSELAASTNLTRRQVNRIFLGRVGTRRKTALLLGRAVGADDVSTLIAAGFDKEILKSVPEPIAEAFRHYGGMLTDEDLKSTIDFIKELVNKNLQKNNYSKQPPLNSAK